MKNCYRIAIIFLLLGNFHVGCYSVEFMPESNYFNLRRTGVGEVAVFSVRPRRAFRSLGLLIIRDYPGGTSNPDFREFLVNEARNRGANGAWVIQKRIYEGVGTLSSKPSKRNTHGPEKFAEQRTITRNVYVVRVMLLVFEPDGG